MFDSQQSCEPSHHCDNSVIDNPQLGLIVHDGDCGNDFAQPVMLYKIYYCFQNDTWGVGYRIKDTKQKKWMDGFKTAREAWLYREALIADGIAKR